MSRTKKHELYEDVPYFQDLVYGCVYAIYHPFIFLTSYSTSYEEPEFDETLVNCEEFLEDAATGIYENLPNLEFVQTYH